MNWVDLLIGLFCLLALFGVGLFGLFEFGLFAFPIGLHNKDSVVGRYFTIHSTAKGIIPC